jgi:alkylhydroperoxidase family enzyme
MRLDTPRVPPLEVEEMDPELRVAFGDGPVLNIFRTLAHHPKLMKRWLVFGNHVLAKSSLAPREREIAILRVGWLCRSEYEWGQHVAIGRQAGLRDEEIERIAEGPEAAGWDERDRALLRATDELHADAFVSDATWKALSAHFDTQQIMDLIFAVGQYHLVSMALNSLGVQLDPGTARFPERAQR